MSLRSCIRGSLADLSFIQTLHPCSNHMQYFGPTLHSQVRQGALAFRQGRMQVGCCSRRRSRSPPRVGQDRFQPREAESPHRWPAFARHISFKPRYPEGVITAAPSGPSWSPGGRSFFQRSPLSGLLRHWLLTPKSVAGTPSASPGAINTPAAAAASSAASATSPRSRFGRIPTEELQW